MQTLPKTSAYSLETLRTKANTTLAAWWPLLNAALARLDASEALFGEVRGYYETGHSPETAAADLIVVRGDRDGAR